MKSGSGGAGSRRHAAETESACLLAMLVGLAAVSVGLLVWQGAAPGAVHLTGLTVDRLSAVLTLLVATVGAVTFRFSQRYLDGEPGQRRFMRWLALTVVAAYVLMLSTHLLLFFAAWSLTSLGLHQLLMFYQGRAEAGPPAQKKFLISRLGDLVLLWAIGLIWQGWGTLDLPTFLQEVTRDVGAGTVPLIGLLIAVAALTKSAQFPFHSWLPETMEAPTPVSALMHAGIINAGGVLLLRFAPLIGRVPEALFLLTFTGTLTVVLGVLAMWAQVKVKRTLAWSTVSQMGFMMIQCGLTAFPVATLHILGHGFYKAWSFLRCGDLPAASTAPEPVPPSTTLTLVGLGTVLSLPALAAAAVLTGFSPLHSPGELALSAVVGLTVGQLWVALLGKRPNAWWGLFVQAGTALATTVAVPLVAFTLYLAAETFFSPVLGEMPKSWDLLASITAAIPVLAIAGLVVVQALLPWLAGRPAGRALYVHALNGFYFGALADRVVRTIWSTLFTAPKEVARG